MWAAEGSNTIHPGSYPFREQAAWATLVKLTTETGENKGISEPEASHQKLCDTTEKHATQPHSWQCASSKLIHNKHAFFGVSRETYPKHIVSFGWLKSLSLFVSLMYVV
ncbi:hypothetical protein [Photobacterium galatheae]|uniref:hypothetical protein n=1 Tax=Photobacterium galatheae TaxID=1654360 RepID=UPI00126821AB|nr:hypothetical protein [Photobacterium galatheae]MCM0151042.1 hypothetical protein [Photobacterium galatheae]